MNTRHLLISAALTLACTTACDDDPSNVPMSADSGAPDADATPTPVGAWSALSSAAGEAFLAVTGTSARDVWVVGADKGNGPAVLHWNGEAWTRERPDIHGDLWWTHAFPGGPVFMAGGRGNVVRYQDGVFTRLDTPGFARHTVFGLWGATPDDLWAVGSVAGRNGFIWRMQGGVWSEVALPEGLAVDAFGDPPGLFKVWGRAANDVYFVGARGLLLHFDGQVLRKLDTPSQGSLFTIHGNADGEVAVGGGAAMSLLEIDADGVTEVAEARSGVLQGIYVDANGHAVACGERGVVYERTDGVWRRVETGVASTFESLHAAWIDPDGGLWAVGGNVLSTSLDAGTILHRPAGDATVASVDPALTTLPMPPPPDVCPAGEADLKPTKTIARRWSEQMLNAIRRDIPRPGVHARNLFHVSAAMYDAWAAFDPTADGYFVSEKQQAADVDAARREAISYAAYRVLSHRYDAARAIGGPKSNACFRDFMAVLGYDPADTTTEGDTPRALGNRIGAAVIAAGVDDGANEGDNYKDTTGWMPANPPLVVDQPGARPTNPSLYQTLNLAVAVTQNGIVTAGGVQGYIGAQWGRVTPFVLERQGEAPYFAAEVIPSFDLPEMKTWVVDAVRLSSQLDPNATEVRDFSPASFGNNPLGTNDGVGHGMNPVTGQAYAPNMLAAGDFGRVLAEFWADGPKSETPPGHWNTLANEVSDAPEFTRKFRGEGVALDPLEWDVKTYFAVNGATHDAAIAAWELKRVHTTARPITLIRHMAELGQSSDPAGPSYDAGGLPLVPDLVEVITAESAAPGQRHADLARFVGEVAIKSWQGEPGDTRASLGGIGWIRGKEWMPYQLRTFVTPAFPGFVSGHSTFSRAAAEVLTAMTGSAYFPGGFAEFVAPMNGYLKFEKGPSRDVHLQWASYYDAADQAGQSRIWGGIHIQPDDFFGRRVGNQVGTAAFAKAVTYFDGTARP